MMWKRVVRCGLLRGGVVVTLALVLCTTAASAQPQSPPPQIAPTQPPQLKVIEVTRLRVKGSDQRRIDRAALNDIIQVKVRDLAQWFKANPSSKFTLVIDGRLMKGLVSGPQDRPDVLQFPLVYGDGKEKDANDLKERREAWAQVLGRPDGVKRRVSISVAHEDGRIVPAERRNFKLYVVRASWTIVCAIVFVVVLVGFVAFGWKSDLLRDSGVAAEGARRPFSLARTQMAVWFFIIFAAFILIWLITGDPNTVKPSLLVLMGISTATALGSVALESKRRSSTLGRLTEVELEHAALQARVAPLATEINDLDHRLKQNPPPAEAAALMKVRTEKQIEAAATDAKARDVVARIADLRRAIAPPRSVGFFTDILTDEAGISLHRFQIAAWTTILLIVFWKSVWESLAMPEFDANLLTLMGLSSGTYIGFKFAEAH